MKYSEHPEYRLAFDFNMVLNFQFETILTFCSKFIDVSS